MDPRRLPVSARATFLRAEESRMILRLDSAKQAAACARLLHVTIMFDVSYGRRRRRRSNALSFSLLSQQQQQQTPIVLFMSVPAWTD